MLVFFSCCFLVWEDVFEVETTEKKRYKHTHTHTYIYIYVYTHTHTYIHIDTKVPRISRNLSRLFIPADTFFCGSQASGVPDALENLSRKDTSMVVTWEVCKTQKPKSRILPRKLTNIFAEN